MGHLISIGDLSDDDLWFIIARGTEFATGTTGTTGTSAPAVLDGRIVGIYFAKTSTRTRTSFSAGALRLGARIITYGPGDLQTNTGETMEDTGAVLALMLDALVARTSADPAELRAWTGQDRMRVINAMTADEHPTQALADLTTLQLHFGHIDNLRILYIGEGNNTAAALALALSRFPGVHLELRTPPGYGLAPATMAEAMRQGRQHAATVTERHDMTDLPAPVDVIYTTRWQTTGSTKKDPNWREIFAPFQVSSDLWLGQPKAVLMHDLPAHRGEEVTAEVLDGPASIAFGQAGNKMYSAMAVLDWCLNGRR